ncbi:hypothetical protein [Sphingobacterium sp.]|uniref:hypothetical protein n=1 Tax=Sphingobacterium sp. TaxID=341027 RepID=UPI0031E003ED
MREHDLKRVKFYSKEDLAGSHQLSKGESILRNEIKTEYIDINDVLELYNIKKYIDNGLYLKSWSQDDIANFKLKVNAYGKIIGQFFSKITNDNIVEVYDKLIHNYIEFFWELLNNFSSFKRISKTNFEILLTKEPYVIREILTQKGIVEFYNNEIRRFLLSYSESAEILLSIYEAKLDKNRKQKFIPKSLTIEDKENIIENYLNCDIVNINFLELIQNARNRAEFKVSDKTRLKAKRLLKNKTEEFFSDNKGSGYGVQISFQENTTKIKDGFIDKDHIIHYIYSKDFLKQNPNFYLLLHNFKYLFEFLDQQNRINLVSKKSEFGLFERIIGIHSQNEYVCGMSFQLSEMTSQGQIIIYQNIISELNTSVEGILHFVFTKAFQERYNFAENARFSIPTANTDFEKVRLLAPEFESILKQFKLFVEDASIDFELLQISSSPTSIKDIPSLNQNKYFYFNEENKEMLGCLNLFFSDQTLLAYVDPFKEKKYHTFFDILVNEQVYFKNYDDFQHSNILFLIEKGFIAIDNDGIIQILNNERLFILKDLYENEVASFYHYPISFQKEAEKMASENIISFESSLFSKQEQAYFNYFLNKSEFTNGLDLRNSYLHGTQANPDELKKHQFAYFSYLKLLVLIILKIDDDLAISTANRIN